MAIDIKRYQIALAVLTFVAVPGMLFVFGDVPARALVKEAFSLLTVLAFAGLLGQFYLARSNRSFVSAFRFSSVLRVHKAVGYTVVVVFLLHPLLIVLPRAFEGGVAPTDALVTLLTTFDSPGIVLGLVAWALLFVVWLTSMFRDRLPLRYPTWKRMHGVLSMLFIVTAAWHAIELGRHMDAAMTTFVVALAATGVVLLLGHYAAPTTRAAGETLEAKR